MKAFSNVAAVSVAVGMVLLSLQDQSFGLVSSQATLPCNPASWCHAQSLLCISDEELKALIDGKDPSTIPADHGRGVCTDAYRWQCNSNGLACKKHLYPLDQAWNRCKLILSPGRNLDLFPGKFVEACRTGEYTCNNGFCTVNVADCAKHGGVRYSNVRCPKDECGGEGLLKEFCQDDSTATEGAQECADEPEGNVLPCCPTPSGEKCRYLELQGGGEELLRQCGGECPDESSCPSINENGEVITPPAKNDTASQGIKYPPSGLTLSFNQVENNKYCCCKISCDCFGDPHCTNFFGEQQTSKVSTGSYIMFKNVEISIEAFLGPPQGIIRKVVITTAADPRTFELNTNQCNNATHNWMDAATGQFISKESVPINWDFEPSPNPNGPSSFIKPSKYKVRDRTAQILIEIKCQPFLWQYNDGQVLNKYRKNTRIDVVVTAWREKKIDELTGEICCPGEQENMDWFLQTGAGGYCVDSSTYELPGGQDNSRLLRQSESSDTLSSPKPTNEIFKPVSRQLASADDVKSRIDNKKFWIGFSEEKLQRLKETNDPEYVKAIEEAKLEAPRRSLATAAELCDEYLRLAEESQASIFTSHEQCLLAIGDFGLGSIEALIELIKTGTKECIDNIYDPRLPGPNGLRECQEGIVLEVRLAGEQEWRAIQSFPASLPYCNNQMRFFFDRVQIEPGRYLNATDSFRLTQCTPDPSICGLCTPLLGIEEYGYSYVYECKSFKAMKNFLKLDFLDSMKTGKISCGFKYLGNPDPFACARSSLKAFFN